MQLQNLLHIPVTGRQQLPIRRIVMQRQQVPAGVFPAVIANYGPRGVKRTCQMVQCLAMCLLRRICMDSGYAPGFVQGGPCHNTGMIDIPEYGLLPFPVQTACGIGGINVCRPYLAPNQQSHPVGMIKKARVLYLLMLSDAVKAHLLDELNIPDKGFVIRRSQQGIRPVTLIQHQLLIIRTVVEQKNTVLYRYLAHSKVGAHPVQSLSFPLYGKQHIKQARPFRRPAQLLKEITLYERIRRIQRNGKSSRLAGGVMRKADNLPPAE